MISAHLRVLIVDDEAPARARLRDLLTDIAADLPNIVVGEASDGLEALEFLKSQSAPPIDVALVDIRMPRLDGIGFAQHLAGHPGSPAVIFVTAYDQYAVRAFDLNAIDYLLKPVRAERLQAALEKFIKLPRALPGPEALRRLAPDGRAQLHSSERGRMLLVPLAEIVFLRAELKYVTARTSEREYLIEEPLTQLEQEFGRRFIRVHRNCLVARDAILGVEREAEEDGEARWLILLRGLEEKIAVSRRQWPHIKALLKQE